MKGLSQEDLAKGVEISRLSLAQIVLGNRSIDVLELQQLSLALNFSLDDFMFKDFTVNENVAGNAEAKSKKVAERISALGLI